MSQEVSHDIYPDKLKLQNVTLWSHQGKSIGRSFTVDLCIAGWIDVCSLDSRISCIMFIGWIDAVSFYEFYELQFFVLCT
jgi:hypothetical protein